MFMNNCIGCHSGMDPMAQSFAYYNFDETTGSIEYTAGAVQPKYFNNDTNFEFGFRTPDDSWQNYWRSGQNQFLGWDSNLPGSGAGAKTMGEELANSDAFAGCQVKKAFQAVCLREPEDQADRATTASGKDKCSNSGCEDQFHLVGRHHHNTFSVFHVGGSLVAHAIDSRFSECLFHAIACFE